MTKSLLKSIIFTLLLIGGGLLVNRTLSGLHIDTQWIDTQFRSQGQLALFYFLFFAVTSMAVGLPRQLSAFSGGYLLGFGLGSVIVSLAALLACVFTFYVGRWVLRPLVRQSLTRLSHKLDRFLSDDVMLKTIAIRLLPVGNNLLTNLAAGVSHAQSQPFFVGSFIGYLPQTLVFVLLGTGASLQLWWELYLGGALLLVSTLISHRLYLRYRQSALLGE